MGKVIGRRKAEWDVMMKKFIYEATVAVLNEHGFEGLRMDRVAKAAEIATGTLYNYFRDKDALLLHVIETRFEPIYEKALNVSKEDMPAPEKLETIVRTIMTFVEEYRDVVDIIFHAKGFSPTVKAHGDAKRDMMVEIIAGIIEDSIRQGFFQKLDSFQAARMIMGAIQGLFETTMNQKRSTWDVERNVSDCRTLFFSGLLIRNNVHANNGRSKAQTAQIKRRGISGHE